MKRVVNYSGGLCSFWTVERVIERYGKDDLTILFADTLIEDEDLYAFNVAAEEHWGMAITRISVGIDPWELFRQEGIIGTPKAPVCSIRLKREPLDEWHRRNCIELDSAIYVGLDWTEEHRIDALRKAKPFWVIEAPMIDPPLWDKCRMIAEAEKLGLPISRLYRLGFPHNNCGGRCVKAGISHFVHLYRVLPAAYMEWEQEEEKTIQVLAARGIEWQSILRDRRGGKTRSMTLRELRERIEAGEKFARDDWGGADAG